MLLIVTDGNISDMAATKAAIVDASTLPLSIVIMGVGPADFSKMRALDSDFGLLAADGKIADRDIVQVRPVAAPQSRSARCDADLVPEHSNGGLRRQFVPFPYDPRNQIPAKTTALAREVLAEIPTQLTSAYLRQRILPASAEVAESIQ